MTELPDLEVRDDAAVAGIFRHYAEVEAPRLDSAVYTALCAGIAEDAALIALAGEARPEQPPPNVLLAAVQDLLIRSAEAGETPDPLAAWYPAISGREIPDASPFPAFRDFCLREIERLRPLVRAGRTQTCVVHRSAVVLPALATLRRVEEEAGRVALLEIGPSAGLNLALDLYRYDYGDGHVWGRDEGTPLLECDDRGPVRAPLPGRLEVVARHGLDLNPIDLADDASIRWLRALIWPEHVLRIRAMDAALERVASLRDAAPGASPSRSGGPPNVPIEIFEGDATRDLEERIAALPSDAAHVLFATQVFYQIPTEGRIEAFDAMARASARHPVDFILVESSGEGDSRVEHLAFRGGSRAARRELARSDSHGRWLAWSDAELG